MTSTRHSTDHPDERLPLVSVIVATKGAAGILEPCLASVRRQSWPRIEVIVVDNHSTDGTSRIAARYADHVLAAGPERSTQRNIGAAAASGDLLVFVDADMELEPNIIAEAVASLKADPEAGMVVLPELAVAEGVFGRARELEKRLYLGDPRAEAARVFRRSAFEAVGGFDETRNSFEDWDLADRVRATGATPARTTSVVRHHEGRVRLRRQYHKKRYYGRQSSGYLAGRQHGVRRAVLLRTSLIRRPGLLVAHPIRAGALCVLKLVELAGMIKGVAEASRGSDGAGHDRPPATGQRVLHVIAAFAPHEAMGRAIGEIALRARGEHHLLAAVVAGADDRFASVVATGGRISWYVFSRRRAIRRAIEAVRPDVIHLHGGRLTPFVAALRAFRGAKVLSLYAWPRVPTWRELRRVRVRALITSQVLAPRVLVGAVVRAAWVRRAASRSDVRGVLTPDPSVFRHLAGIPADVLHVVGGSDPDPRRAVFEPHQPVVVFAGRAEAVRGIDLLIDAMTIVRRTTPGARLRLLLLDRPDLRWLTAKLDGSGLGASAELRVGPYEDLRAELAAATVAAFPFRFDHVTVPPALTAAEAMSVGLPVVVTSATCLTTIAEHGRNALVVPVGDPCALADAITHLLSDQGTWQAIADGAAGTVGRGFDWQDVADAATWLYEHADRRPASRWRDA